MATRTLASVGDRLGFGTSVAAHPRTQWPAWQPPSGAPSGSPTASSTTNATTGAVTFTGLADNTAYVIYAVGKPLIGFSTAVEKGITLDANGLLSDGSDTVAKIGTAQTFSQPQKIVAADGGIVNFESGPGTAYGAPATAPTVATGAAGALTGAYKYVYTEVDFWGETTPSPASATVNPSAQKVTVTLPLPRRGISARKLYRTVAGGSTYKLVSDLSSGGSGYFQTVFTDNLADASLGATAPAADSTKLMNVHVRESVKYLRTGPAQGSAAADLTLHTADPGGAALAIDAYGPVLSRTTTGAHSFQAEHVGAAPSAGDRLVRGTFLNSATAQDAQTPPTPSEVFFVDGPGNVQIAPLADIAALKIIPFASTTSSVLVLRDATNATDALVVNKNGQMKITPGTDTQALILQANAATAGTNLLQLSQPSGAGNSIFTVGATGVVTIRPSTDVNPALQVLNAAGTTYFAVRTDTGAVTLGGIVNVNNTMNVADAKNITFGTGTGTKIGTATSQKISFFNATPVVQQSAGVAATDAASTQTLANALRTALVNLGLAA